MIETFICYTEWADSFKYLSVEQKARLLDLIFDFAATGECPEVEDAALNIVFGTIRRSIENNYRKYLETCGKRRIAGRKGGQAPRKQMQANTSKRSQMQDNTISDTCNVLVDCSDDEYDFVDDMVLSSAADTGERERETVPDGNSPAFVPPTLEEVEEYVGEKDFDMDAELFFDHYVSIGWVTSSGQSIKDWRAAVRNWAKREEQYQ